jgi:hypothetical protein
VPNRRDALAFGLASVASAFVAPALAVPARPPARRLANASAIPHDPRGQYLDYLTRANIAGGSNVRLDTTGVIMVQRGESHVYNPVTIAQYGLQQFSYWAVRGDQTALHRAVLQAGWLVANQNTSTGAWAYDYPFGVGAMSETLPAGWTSAMAQGQAMSLLARIYSVYPTKSAYRTAALRARWPLSRRVADGGLLTEFHGHPHYEEYPTRSAPTLALNGFQFCLVGLWDANQVIPSAEVSDLFHRGYDTMVYQLPYHDMVTTSAYHLGHLTKAPRAVHHADSYHRIHVLLLTVLHAFRAHPVVAFYRDRWATYPPMGN